MDTGHVVWSAPNGQSREIFAYDLATGVTTKLTDNQGTDFRPQVAGDLVTWLFGTQNSAEVYLANLAAGGRKRLGGGVHMNASFSTGPSSFTPAGPFTDGRYVVWWQNSPQASSIVLYDAESAETVNLGAGLPGDLPRLAGGGMVGWRPGADGNLHLLAYDLASHAETEVAEGSLGDALTNGRQVAWVAYEKLQGPSETWIPQGLLLKRVR
ncbi:MAG: hypothetical protein M1325_03945 [Actinobacteria bacterium]|nr:hypothetical protein [Actinomycetota bacterium]